MGDYQVTGRYAVIVARALAPHCAIFFGTDVVPLEKAEELVEGPDAPNVFVPIPFERLVVLLDRLKALEDHAASGLDEKDEDEERLKADRARFIRTAAMHIRAGNPKIDAETALLHAQELDELSWRYYGKELARTT